MAERQPPRGRGAALLAALKKKQVGAQEEVNEEKPPKPKGRAAFLKQLQENRLKKVGGAHISQSSTEVSKNVEKEIEEVSKSVSQLSIEKEPVLYRGKNSLFKIVINVYSLYPGKKSVFLLVKYYMYKYFGIWYIRIEGPFL